jgi:hypothetical protein
MHRLPFLCLIVLATLQCKRHSEGPPSPNDANTVLLKTATLENLPSPYFYYIYDNQHFVTQIEYASALRVYHPEYINGRVAKMTDSKTGRVCTYVYTGKNVPATLSKKPC